MKSVSHHQLNPYREPQGTTPGYYYPVHVKAMRARHILKCPGSQEKEKVREELSAHMATQVITIQLGLSHPKQVNRLSPPRRSAIEEAKQTATRTGKSALPGAGKDHDKVALVDTKVLNAKTDTIGIGLGPAVRHPVVVREFVRDPCLGLVTCVGSLLFDFVDLC